MAVPEPHVTLLDACAVVSLYATRRMPEILQAWSPAIAIVDIVEREAQYVRRGGDGDDASERELILLAPLMAAGVLSVMASNDDDELATFIDLAQHLDDGEAMTAALAMHRGCRVVTDDRKAVRMLTDRGVGIHSTLELVKHWAAREHLDRVVQREVLNDLRTRGTYEPSRNHPLRTWWEQVITFG